MSKEIEQFKQLQERVFNEVSDNRNDYYEGKITRQEYIAERLQAGKRFFTSVSKIITPSSSDTSWIDISAEETLRQEDKEVLPKITGLTKREMFKLCYLESKHANEFINEIVKRNFSSLVGKDYKSEWLRENWSITDESERPDGETIKSNYEKVWR